MQKIKKESGENPERTGHCKWTATLVLPLVHTGKVREAQRSISQETCQHLCLKRLPGKGYACTGYFCVN